MLEQAFDRRIWEELERDNRQSSWTARRLVTPCRAYIAVDDENRRHLLVAAPRSEWLRDDQSRGLRLQGQELSIGGNPVEPYLDLCCVEPAGHPAFDLVIDRVLAHLAEGHAASAALQKTLTYWRRFWLNSLSPGPSAEELRGLFGELWFLSRWLLPKDSGAIFQWKGPSGARHDFESPGLSVEVKTTASTGAPIHRINGLEQLMGPASGALFLFSLRVRPEEGATENLLGLLEQVRKQLAGDGAAQSHLDYQLEQFHYSPLHEPLYERARLRVVSERLYQVTGGFPRLTPSSFPAGLPVGVSGIAYDLDLNACEAYVVARNAGDWLP